MPGAEPSALAHKVTSAAAAVTTSHRRAPCARWSSPYSLGGVLAAIDMYRSRTSSRPRARSYYKLAPLPDAENPGSPLSGPTPLLLLGDAGLAPAVSAAGVDDVGGHAR